MELERKSQRHDWLVGVKEDMTGFGLLRDDAQVWEKCRN